MSGVKLRDVLTALWSGCAGVIEFRALTPAAQKFAALAEKKHFGAFLRVHAEQNCFWGVATRLDDSSGEAENCKHLPALFVDLDFNKTAEVAARQTLVQIPLPPSLVIHSGHGLHAYWLVHEPFDLEIERECTDARTLLARLAVYCASDAAVVDVARVLRVPTTRNHKYTPPRLVQVEAFDPQRKYDPLEFDGWLPPPPADDNAPSKPFKVPAVVEPGNRNNVLFKLGRSLKAKGIAPDAVRVALEVYNGRIADPLPADEVEAIAEGVQRRRNRPAFEQSSDAADATEASSEPAPPATLPDQPLADLLDAVVAYLATFVVMGVHERRATALWIVHTHAFGAAEHTPYLHVTSGTKRAGKSLLLDLLEQAVRRPWLTARTTTAALVRKLDKVRPTLLLDELDQALRGGDDYAATLTQVLNAGFKAGGAASICRGEGAALQVVDLNVFSPKALCGIGSLPDTVADRSIVIALRRKTRDERVSRARARAIRAAAAPLRVPLERWGITLTAALKGAEPAVPEALDDRGQDVWTPLLAIADHAGGDWPVQARAAAVALAGGRTDDDIAVTLLRDVAALLTVQDTPVVLDDIVSSSRVLKRLVRLPERPWQTWSKGKELSSRAFADLLKRLDLQSDKYWVESEGHQVRGYRTEAVKAACARYLPSNPSTRPNPNNDGPELPMTTRLADPPVDGLKNTVSPITTGVSDEWTGCDPKHGDGSGNGASDAVPDVLPGWVTEPAVPDTTDPIGAHDEEIAPLRCCLDGGSLWLRCRGCTAVDAAIRDRVHAEAPGIVRTPTRKRPAGQQKGGPTPPTPNTGSWGRPN